VAEGEKNHGLLLMGSRMFFAMADIARFKQKAEAEQRFRVIGSRRFLERSSKRP
jgi:hypothetical protein